MTPEAGAREQIDNRLRQSGWTIQDLKQLNLTVASGVAVREFPTNTGPVDYALFIEGVPVGVVEAKKDEEGQALTDVETQSSRYANSQFKWVKREYKVRFAYEALANWCVLPITQILIPFARGILVPPPGDVETLAC